MGLYTKSKLRNFFKDKDGHVVLWQWPNVPLWGWIITKFFAMVLDVSWLNHGLNLLSTALLFTWAYLEITEGASPFRKTLGTLVMLLVLVNLFR